MARITPIHLIPALIAAASHGGELTIEQRPFVIEKTFTAAVLPSGDCQLITLEPLVWENFSLLEIATHGAKVTKGETLVKFDCEAIDQKLEDTRKALDTQALTLAQAETELKNLQETGPHRLEAARRAAAIAKEESTYFTTVRRKAAEGIATQGLKRSEQILANQREELKQLTKMYEADDVTEDTEEIILIRQQDAVAAAEFALSMEVLEHKRTLEVSLPREAKSLADEERDTALRALKAEEEIPRAIDLKKIELEALKTNHSRLKKSLEKHEKDRTLFEFKAPADGTFYHGPIENGKWTTGDLVKALILHKPAPLHRAFATFVPATARLDLVAFIDQATQRALKPDATGLALLAGSEDLEIPVKLTRIASAPAIDSTYQVDLTATWPKETLPSIGSTAEIRIISYQQPTTISVPTRAITFGIDGWTVEVKLADGKTERRPVKRGLSSKDETEILSGLDVGQVVVVP
jgi:hypothetical protein